jgi:hypothetical protein
MKKVQEILSVFQEGVFEEFSLNERDLNFKMECRYLADQIHSEYTYFYGVFKGVKDVFFVPWDDDLLEIRSLNEIKKLRLDILSVDVEDNYIKVYSNCQHCYSGGNLFIDASSIKIFDEDFVELQFEDLLDLSDKYWYHNNKAEG